ncbi:MAG: hypothetical protein ABIP39_09695 [Polyangiaceae bacterium]
MSASSSQLSPRTTIPGKRLVLVGGGVMLVVVISIVVGFGAFGRGRYVRSSKMAEGRIQAVNFARGLVACSDHTLPATSKAVPATLDHVAGHTYESVLADWSDPAFACAKFAVAGPQYFQYQWERMSPGRGVVRATSDLDGDGVEMRFSIAVVCDENPARFACALGPLQESTESAQPPP